MITTADVKRVAKILAEAGPPEILRGVRRAMAQNMALAQSEVAPATVMDDADIHAWKAGTDVTIRLVRALVAGCAAEPGLNAWYEGHTMARRIVAKIDVGIAIDLADGLFVPVLRDVAKRDASDLRGGLERMRKDLAARKIPAEELRGNTITLSNFGMIGGKYAAPIVMPPTVAILGAGRIHEQVLAVDGKPAVRRVLPLSLSFDHRVVTGGGRRASWPGDRRPGPARVVPALARRTIAMDEIELLADADVRAGDYVAGARDRRVFPGQKALSGLARFDEALPARACPPGRRWPCSTRPVRPPRSPRTGRYFGFVIGASQPVAAAAERLAIAWDQCASSFDNSPAAATIEKTAARWVLEALDLPAGSAVGFGTSASACGLACLSAARRVLLAREGWDFDQEGLGGAPQVRVVVSATAHVTLVKALRMMGFGLRHIVRAPVDPSAASTPHSCRHSTPGRFSACRRAK